MEEAVFVNGVGSGWGVAGWDGMRVGWGNNSLFSGGQERERVGGVR